MTWPFMTSEQQCRDKLSLREWSLMCREHKAHVAHVHVLAAEWSLAYMDVQTQK